MLEKAVADARAGQCEIELQIDIVRLATCKRFDDHHALPKLRQGIRGLSCGLKDGADRVMRDGKIALPLLVARILLNQLLQYGKRLSEVRKRAIEIALLLDFDTHSVMRYRKVAEQGSIVGRRCPFSFQQRARLIECRQRLLRPAEPILQVADENQRVRIVGFVSGRALVRLERAFGVGEERQCALLPGQFRSLMLVGRGRTRALLRLSGDVGFLIMQ
ncbi:hypothetical protein PQQ78_02830 [Paraburkholderia sediminicola]